MIRHGCSALLVLSHMRSYSTLLAHLLHEHPKISGWEEQHRSYRTTSDLESLIAGQCNLPGVTVACDNLLHNGYSIGAPVYDDDRVRWVISVRNARPTLKSMARWGGPKNIYRSGSAAADYYCGRLRWLMDVGSRLDGRFVLLRSDRLISQPHVALNGLTDALGLDPPLSATYTPAESTGEASLGDFSRFIRAGTIVRERKYQLDPPLAAVDIRRSNEQRRLLIDTLVARAAVVI